jgi:hypothetical protein
MIIPFLHVQKDETQERIVCSYKKTNHNEMPICETRVEVRVAGWARFVMGPSVALVCHVEVHASSHLDLFFKTFIFLPAYRVDVWMPVVG